MAHFFKLNRESVSDLPMKGKIPFGYRTNLDPGLIFLLNIFLLADRSPFAIHDKKVSHALVRALSELTETGAFYFSFLVPPNLKNCLDLEHDPILA